MPSYLDGKNDNFIEISQGTGHLYIMINEDNQRIDDQQVNRQKIK